MLPLSERWIEGFLRFYWFGAPFLLEDQSEERCRFNSTISAVSDVLKLVEQQAAGTSFTYDETAARAVAMRLYRADVTAQKEGGAVAAALRDGRRDDAVSMLEGRPMPALVAALGVVRASGELDKLTPEPVKPRVRAAALALQGRIGSRYLQAAKDISDEDQQAIAAEVYVRLLAGDLAAEIPALVRQGAPQVPFAGSPAIGRDAWIRGFLAHFATWRRPDDPTGRRVVFNARELDLSAVVDTACEQALRLGLVIERPAVAAAIGDMGAVPGAAGAPAKLVLGWTIVPRTWHKGVGMQSPPPDPVSEQPQAGVTFSLHKEGESGGEVSFAGQTQITRDPTRGTVAPQNVVAMAQASWVKPLIRDVLEYSVFGQAALGAAWAGKVSDGAVVLAPVTQVAAGQQALYAIPGTDGKLKIGGQAAVQFTTNWGPGLPQTVDLMGGLVIQYER